jgi:hypothetical protein
MDTSRRLPGVLIAIMALLRSFHGVEVRFTAFDWRLSAFGHRFYCVLCALSSVIVFTAFFALPLRFRGTHTVLSRRSITLR